MGRKCVRNLQQILAAKRDGKELSEEEIELLVQGITDGELEDAQLGAFLSSTFINGMSKAETAFLTRAMKNSGSIFSWDPSWVVGDKHSTGGVGDKVSLALAPALAANNLKVPMISGRGLGHTGGTLDKLESIPGFRVNLSSDEIRSTLETVGCCIVGQTASIVPADRRMYATRDVTATVASQPLIVSSIISKKLCESLHGLVLDVKFGSGSVAGNFESAVSLAESLVDASSSQGVPTTAFISSMESPVGLTVGNALEVKEAIEVMAGGGPDDLRDLVIQLGGELLSNCQVCSSSQEGRTLIEKSITDFSALKKFSQMIQCQGVSKSVADKLCGEHPDFSDLPSSRNITTILSPTSGTVSGMDAMKIAELCLALGAGRAKSSDLINFGSGVVLSKSIGDQISSGESWCHIHHDQDALLPSIQAMAESALSVSPLGQKVDAHVSRVVRVVKSSN